MGSALLLVIVVGWVCVVVPMLVRRHDHRSESTSVERFTGSMRALARRTSPSAPESPEPTESAEAGRERPTAARLQTPAQARAGRLAGRRRTLVGLLVAALAALLLALSESWAWVVQGLADLALVVYLVHLRREALFEARHRRRLAGRLAGRRVVPAVVPVPAAARETVVPNGPVHDELSAAASVQTPDAVAAVVPEPDEVDEHGWLPVPVPLPTYVTAARAEPRRAPSPPPLPDLWGYVPPVEGQLFDQEDPFDERRVVNG